MTARLGCTCFNDRAVKRWELSSLYRIARASNYVSATGRFCAMFLLKCNFLDSSDEVTVNKIDNKIDNKLFTFFTNSAIFKSGTGLSQCKSKYRFVGKNRLGHHANSKIMINKTILKYAK